MKATTQLLTILREHPNGLSVVRILTLLPEDAKAKLNGAPLAHIRGTLHYLKTRGKVKSTPIYPEWPGSPKKWKLVHAD